MTVPDSWTYRKLTGDARLDTQEIKFAVNTPNPQYMFQVHFACEKYPGGLWEAKRDHYCIHGVVMLECTAYGKAPAGSWCDEHSQWCPCWEEKGLA